MADFDDSAALALALSSPDDFDVKLVLSATGDTTRRAQIVARYLDLYDRTDVPVGVGVNTTLRAGPLWGWAETYPLSAYPGPVYTDGVGAAIKIIQESSETVLIAAIAPANNFPSLLKRCPECAAKVQVVAMSGSIYRGYGNSSSPNVEYNGMSKQPGFFLRLCAANVFNSCVVFQLAHAFHAVRKCTQPSGPLRWW